MPPQPSHLYRRILQLHRRMPEQFRALGDAHVRDEFYHHRPTTDPRFLGQFFKQWEDYAKALGEQLDKGGVRGESLGDERVQRLDVDKTQRLWELRKETRGTRDPQ